MFVGIRIIPDLLINEPSLGGMQVCLPAVCMFVYSCSHLSFSGCTLTSYVLHLSKHKHTVSMLRAQNKLEHSVQEKLARG